MPDPSQKNILANRHERLNKSLEKSRLDALVLNAGQTLTYLTGLHFHLSERPVVAIFAPQRLPVLVLPELEAGKVDQLTFQAHSYTYGEDPSTRAKAFQQAASSLQLHGARVGVEPHRLRFLELRLLEGAATKVEFLAAEQAVGALRMYKDPFEIEAMRKAVDIAQRALAAALPAARSGVSEKEFAAELTLQILRSGSDPEMPFSPIVASGPNSANPHAFPTDRTFSAGDLLILDWGASYRGYFSDLTRTFAIGQTEDELSHIAGIVAKANTTARDMARPGIPAGEVDRAARSVIESAGYGRYFIHRTGHGLGLEGHEEPYIYEGNSLLLQPGMTFTIEPGIYLPGRGGVRVEDDVLITLDGCLSLSDLPRELVTIS
jgi:Xaa-Pro dipeptidase